MVLALRLAIAALTLPPLLWLPQLLLGLVPCYVILRWPSAYAIHRLPLLLAHMLLLCLWTVHVVMPAVLQHTPVPVLASPSARFRLAGLDIMLVNALLQVRFYVFLVFDANFAPVCQPLLIASIRKLPDPAAADHCPVSPARQSDMQSAVCCARCGRGTGGVYAGMPPSRWGAAAVHIH